MLAALVSLLSLAPVAPAPLEGPVHARFLTCEVRIVEGVATNRLRLEIANEGPRQEEAYWILPLGAGAVADDFRMRTGDVELKGEVLASDRARGVYEQIVRARRDPGLLEYMGQGCLRARVFPIPANGKVEVEVTWREILPEVSGLRRWTFPVAAAGLGGQPPEQVVLELQVESTHPIANVFSSTPGLDVVREDEHHASASFEGRGDALPSRDLVLFHTLSEREFGLDVLSTRTRPDDDGTFLMLISPRRALVEERSAPRRITFVLDVSGSMEGRKLEQALGGLRAFLEGLRPEDDFNIVPFSTEARPFWPSPVRADRGRVVEGLRKVAALQARGGTNLDEALEAALSGGPPSGDRVPIVVLLTDGVPTLHERDPLKILAHAREWNTGEARVFVMGVGDDVNTILLDTLAEEHGGTRGYVRPQEDIQLATRTLLEAVSHPVLTDLELAVDEVELERVVPRRLPDLFSGGRLIVAGRYRGAGPCRVRLTGTLGGERRTYVYECELASGPVQAFDFVPSLWAERRIGALLDEIRLHGSEPELVDEVRRLGIEYNLVTPYTSHLILEEGLEVARTPGGHGGGGAYSGPATPGPAAVTTGGFGSGPTTVAGTDSVDIVELLAQRLRAAGVLPDDAAPEELRRLAQEVASEMRSSAAGLSGLGREATGRRAVEDSEWLEKLTSPGGTTNHSGEFFLGRGQASRSVDLLALFTRRIRDKVFDLRKGVWVERGLPEGEDAPERVVVEAFTQAWFDLLQARPELRPYLAFSPRIVVACEGVVYEVRPPAPRAETPADDGATQGGSGDRGERKDG